MNAIELSLFSSRLAAVSEQMGMQLRRSAFSPNIRDRLDFSCAVFDATGELCAQAAHIPVHLGSMAYAMRGVVSAFDWSAGDMVIFNDPFLGGTHLPDVTVVAPVFVGGGLLGFVANRAHHADIGSDSPGSMPLSRRLEEEGLIIPPSLLISDGRPTDVYRELLAALRDPLQAEGDLKAQIAANRLGVQRLQERIPAMGPDAYRLGLAALNDYAERMARSALADIPPGVYCFRDLMDDDGVGNADIAIQLRLECRDGAVIADFDGTAPQVDGNINCPLAVTAAAVFYALRCLMPTDTPACAGALRPISIRAPEASLVHAQRPAAVAAGNVETSQRIVDVMLGALVQALPERIPAASCGSMNNVALGSDAADGWSYYETIGGGMGAGAETAGLSAVQTHMTNTLNTPIEVLESRYPLRVQRYAVRSGSGGAGARRGGDGIVREFEFLAPARYTVLSERRRRGPWGLAGGAAGLPGENRLNGEPLAAKAQGALLPGDRLCVMTPGGGGHGRQDALPVEAAEAVTGNG